MNELEKPDLKHGVSIASLSQEGKLRGVADREDALVVRRGPEFFAVGAHCTHYHGRSRMGSR